jgi:hypothetical protein
MKKFENLGKSLTKEEQKKINGGYEGGCGTCSSTADTCNAGCQCTGCPDIGYSCSKKPEEHIQ